MAAGSTAAAPATVGTNRYIHTCANAVPPTRIAGPRLRAPLTEEPDTGMKAKWITIRVRPMIRPAIGVPPLDPVTARITSVKISVPVSQVYWLTTIFLKSSTVESETVVMLKQS